MPLLSKVLKSPKIKSGDYLEIQSSYKLERNPKADEKEAAPNLEEVEQKAKKILENARVKAADELKRAYAIGHQQGMQEGQKQFQIEAEKRYLKIKQALDGVFGLKDEIIAATERDLLNLAVTIAEKLIAKHLELSSDTIIAITKAASYHFHQADQIVIFANPDDAHTLKYRKDELKTQFDEYTKVYIVEDGNLTAGSCRIESAKGIIDAALKTQLEKLRLTILGDK